MPSPAVPTASSSGDFADDVLASARAPVVLLTRDEHRNGAWLTDLERALAARGAAVLVLPLSEFRGAEARWRCLVNRVSDAAPPADAKLCLAACRSAQMCGVPTINGGGAYALGSSKLLHYQLFALCELPTPPYAVLRRGGPPLLEVARTAGLRPPLLLKPNAGGFGAGISLLEEEGDLAGAAAEAALEKALGDDGVALLQSYAKPDEGVTYRVFFLGEIVQCGVRVRAPAFNACLRSAPHDVWDVPPPVRAAVGRVAAASGADCGSVELLYSAGEQCWFDFNCLSTLPPAKAEGKPDQYDALAQHILACATRAA
jgi:hypothetical protein